MHIQIRDHVNFTNVLDIPKSLVRPCLVIYVYMWDIISSVIRGLLNYLAIRDLINYTATLLIWSQLGAP